MLLHDSLQFRASNNAVVMGSHARPRENKNGAACIHLYRQLLRAIVFVSRRESILL